MKEEIVAEARLSCFSNKWPRYLKVSLQSDSVSSPRTGPTAVTHMHVHEIPDYHLTTSQDPATNWEFMGRYHELGDAGWLITKADGSADPLIPTRSPRTCPSCHCFRLAIDNLGKKVQCSDQWWDKIRTVGKNL